MTAIAGIQSQGAQDKVTKMLNRMSHRGSAWQLIVEKEGAILGVSGQEAHKEAAHKLLTKHIAQEMINQSHFASAKITKVGISLLRDPLGISPLYYGKTSEGNLCFASEVKGMLAVTRDIHELPPGQLLDGTNLIPHLRLNNGDFNHQPVQRIVQELRSKIEVSVIRSTGEGEIGSWLSGGIDSTALAAIARPYVNNFHTFVAGFEGSPDIYFADMAAKHIQSIHHEMVVTPDQVINSLPKVIYYLESFDALLIRSSILNFLVAELASDYVPAVFSGEGGDELFAGYDYLQTFPPDQLQDELEDILGRLHNTALQRVDRSASSNGLVAHVGLLDQEVVKLAMRIPVKFKIKDGIEKWILRKAVEDLLPEKLLLRKKAKFWQGAGVQNFIADYANQKVSDKDFRRERFLKSGAILNTKEELFYYRIFRDHFGDFDDLAWMGRTKGAPVSQPS
jgi:asparagine synthase (glutamine-hydrolysing)